MSRRGFPMMLTIVMLQIHSMLSRDQNIVSYHGMRVTKLTGICLLIKRDLLDGLSD